MEEQNLDRKLSYYLFLDKAYHNKLLLFSFFFFWLFKLTIKIVSRVKYYF